MRSLGPRVHHYEFWDREFGFDHDFAAKLLGGMHRRQKKKTYSVRVLASTFDDGLFELFDERYFRRLIIEIAHAVFDQWSA